MTFLVNQVLEIWCNFGSIQFSHKLVPIWRVVLIYREFSPFLASFPHLSGFIPILWKSVKFELHVCDSFLGIFWKNHFKVENEWFYHRKVDCFQNSAPLNDYPCRLFWHNFQKNQIYWNNAKKIKPFGIMSPCVY